MNSLTSYIHKYSCKCIYLLTTLNVKEEEKLLKSRHTIYSQTIFLVVESPWEKLHRFRCTKKWRKKTPQTK